MFIWQKQLTKEISFVKSLIVISIFFLSSAAIIYYTSVSSQAIVNNYSNLISARSNLLSEEDGGIFITRPKPNEYVGNHFFISGKIDLNAEKIGYRIINEEQKELKRGSIIIENQNLSTEVDLDETNLTPEGMIEFYYKSANEEKSLLILPIKFL